MKSITSTIVTASSSNNPQRWSLSMETREELRLTCFPGVSAPIARLLIYNNWHDIFLVRHIPTWFPGAGFKRHATETEKVHEELIRLPYEEVKGKRVSLSTQSYDELILNIVDSRRELLVHALCLIFWTTMTSTRIRIHNSKKTSNMQLSLYMLVVDLIPIVMS